MHIYYILLMAYSIICPFLAVTFFVMGYNLGGNGKLQLMPKKKANKEKSPDEIMLERIDKAEVYRKKDN